MTERVVFRLPAACAAAFFEWCRARGVAQKTLARDEKTGDLTLSLPARAFSRLQTETALSVTVLKRVGLAVRLRALARRPGLLAGLLLAVSLLIASRLFLWEVRVTDADGMTADEVLAALEETGVSPGAFLPRLDTAAAALRLCGKDERVAYAAVNVTGTVAYVQIRTVKEAAPPPEKAPADLVAAEDGVIREMLIFAGECLVGEGDAVRRGQVLVRGCYTAGEEKETVRLTRAAGTVTAETTHTARIEVPLTYAVRQRTGRRQKETTLFFFGARQKLFKNAGKNYNDCDIIETEKRLPAGNGRFLPFGAVVKTAYETVEVTLTRTEEEALAEARRQWREQMAGGTEKEVLAVRETVEKTENGLVVTFVADCRENIAVTVEVSPLP